LVKRSQEIVVSVIVISARIRRERMGNGEWGMGNGDFFHFSIFLLFCQIIIIMVFHSFLLMKVYLHALIVLLFHLFVNTGAKNFVMKDIVVLYSDILLQSLL